MNINGHEVERRDDGRMYVDGAITAYGGCQDDPAYYARQAETIRKEAKIADLVAEFVRREQAEKAEQDAARELDRRAAIVVDAWFGAPRLDAPKEPFLLAARRVVRALDADATEQEA